jgi:1-deoxy-D-xylulose-5-phosphate synthase
MVKAIYFAKDFPTPCAFRYPRGAFSSQEHSSSEFELGKSHTIQKGSNILLIGYGNGVGRAIETAKLMDNSNPTILDLRFVKPLDTKRLEELAKTHKKWFVFSDSAKIGGVGSALLGFLADNSFCDIDLTTFEYEDSFITHGNTKLVEKSLGLLPEQLVKHIEV